MPSRSTDRRPPSLGTGPGVWPPVWPLRYQDETYRERLVASFERSIELDMATLGMRRDDDANRVLISVPCAAIEGVTMQHGFRRSEMDLDACFARPEEALAPAFLEATEHGETS